MAIFVQKFFISLDTGKLDFQLFGPWNGRANRYCEAAGEMAHATHFAVLASRMREFYRVKVSAAGYSAAVVMFKCWFIPL